MPTKIPVIIPSQTETILYIAMRDLNVQPSELGLDFTDYRNVLRFVRINAFFKEQEAEEMKANMPNPEDLKDDDLIKYEDAEAMFEAEQEDIGDIENI